MNATTDSELLQRWTDRRDAEAFREIAVRYAGMVYGTCRRILEDPTEAEDAAQETFETLARKGGAVGRYLPAWLHRVATNRYLDRLRSSDKRRAREHEYGRMQVGHEDPPWDDIHRYVDEVVEELPELYRR